MLCVTIRVIKSWCDACDFRNEYPQITQRGLEAATKTLAQTASFCHDLHTTKKGRITCTSKELVLNDRKDDRFKVGQGSIT